MQVGVDWKMHNNGHNFLTVRLVLPFFLFCIRKYYDGYFYVAIKYESSVFSLL